MRLPRVILPRRSRASTRLPRPQIMPISSWPGTARTRRRSHGSRKDARASRRPVANSKASKQHRANRDSNGQNGQQGQQGQTGSTGPTGSAGQQRTARTGPERASRARVRVKVRDRAKVRARDKVKVKEGGGSNSNNLGNGTDGSGNVRPGGQGQQPGNGSRNSTVYQPYTPSGQAGEQGNVQGQQGTGGQTEVKPGQYGPGANNESAGTIRTGLWRI